MEEPKWIRQSEDLFTRFQPDGSVLEFVSRVTTCGWTYLYVGSDGKIGAPRLSYHSAENAMQNGPRNAASVVGIRLTPWVPKLREKVKPSPSFLKKFFGDWHDVKELTVVGVEMTYIDGKFAWYDVNAAERFPNRSNGDVYNFVVYENDLEMSDLVPLEAA